MSASFLEKRSDPVVVMIAMRQFFRIVASGRPGEAESG
jgi:hypothetical protein